MMHATIRATLLPEIVKLISSRYGWSEEEAMDRFYDSATGASFSDDDTGLYGQSALYIFGLFAEEMDEYAIICSEKRGWHVHQNYHENI